ncbi:MAG: sensor histidine kinase [Actinomycetia bacterium]|nr:sensor histidine kinase [Actinomycetes bacterium]
MRDVVRTLFAEPRVPDPPARVWRDWVLVAVLLSASAVEWMLRDDLSWSTLSFAVAVAMIIMLLWRRTHPLIMVVIAFGLVTAMNIATLVTGTADAGLYTSVFIALFPYSLFRWASGRQAEIGLIVIVVAAVFGSVVTGLDGSSENVVLESVIGIALFLLLPAALGASVRYETIARLREIDHVKLTEREQLARELHDTVAHHVSAIAIQAQAGRTVATTDPGAAVNALEIIEQEAARTLTEMRSMVGVLRDDDGVELSPQRGVADIERLVGSTGDSPRIRVELSGDLDDLTPSVNTAVYRLAQESITNALRHARHATSIDVTVDGDEKSVRLTVTDDGDANMPGRSPSGYGLIGMAERVAILGGTLEAGPNSGRGWIVSAVLPKVVAST